jgi:hypothetical protein
MAFGATSSAMAAAAAASPGVLLLLLLLQPLRPAWRRGVEARAALRAGAAAADRVEVVLGDSLVPTSVRIIGAIVMLLLCLLRLIALEGRNGLSAWTTVGRATTAMCESVQVFRA